MRRANLRAQGIDPDTGLKTPQDNTHNTDNIDKPSDEKEHNTDKTYKADYRGLYRFIHTDKAMLLAQKWGMIPGLLYNLCRDYSTYYVKQVIDKVNGIGDGYFRASNNQTINSQRGKLCRAIILKEGVRLKHYD